MVKILLLLALSLPLAGCPTLVTTVKTYDPQTGKKIGQTPASIVAMEKAQGEAEKCRNQVFTTMGSASVSGLSTSAEVALFQIVMAQLNSGSLVKCQEIVARIASEFNATDRARIGLVRSGVTIGLGGYFASETVGAIAAAAGTKVITNIKGNTTGSNGTGAGGGGVTDGLPGGAGSGNAGGAGISVDTNIVGRQAQGQFNTGDGTLNAAEQNLPIGPGATTAPLIGDGSTVGDGFKSPSFDNSKTVGDLF